jgi:hypothetical protein
MDSMRFRVGRTVGRTIYRQVGSDPSDVDELIGVMDTAGLAALAVAAMNGGAAEVYHAARRLCACIVASAHLLDAPSADAPGRPPWTKVKQEMAALCAALGIRLADIPDRI